MDLPRPLTLLPLCFFMIGWGLFTAGFGWLLGTSDSIVMQWGLIPLSTSSRTDPSLYHLYVTLAGGPIVALAGLLHALVNVPILGSILGVISAVVSVIYFVSAGTTVVEFAINITYTVHPPFSPSGRPADVKGVLMLSGTLLQGVCWCIVLMLSVFYTYRRAGEDHWNTVVHRPSRRWPFTPGLGRILCIPCVILSAVGWCIFVGATYNKNHQELFLTVFFIIPLLAYLAALLHAGCSGGASTIMGVFTAILNMLFLSFMGDETISAAIELHSGNCKDVWWYYYKGCYYDKIALGGCILCLSSWGCVLALWPFYRKHPGPPSVYYAERTNQNTLNYGTSQHYPIYYSDTSPLIEQ